MLKGVVKMIVVLSEASRARLLASLEEAYPNEGGGFLVGTRQGEQVVIEDVLPIPNVFEEAEQFHRYAMTPQNWATMEDKADSMGLALVGYYHSHPDSPAIPSEYDRVHALPHFVYLIASVVQARAVSLFAYELVDDRSTFKELPLVSAS